MIEILLLTYYFGRYFLIASGTVFSPPNAFFANSHHDHPPLVIIAPSFSLPLCNIIAMAKTHKTVSPVDPVILPSNAKKWPAQSTALNTPQTSSHEPPPNAADSFALASAATNAIPI